MEILHDTSNRRTLLALLDQSSHARDFSRLLEQTFNLVFARDVRECLNIMRERATSLSVVVADVDMAVADDYALLRTAAGDARIANIPIVIGAVRDLTDDDLRCLNLGAVDFVMKPYHEKLMVKRIENAIRIKRSTNFYEIEAILRELPSNIFLKDAECRYVFATHYWHHLKMDEGDPNWDIRGKTDLEIRKDLDNAMRAYESDKEILRTGKGAEYMIEINTDGVQEFLELIKRPVFDEDGNATGIIALANDVTEAELAKRELEKHARTDELTGLANHRAFDEALQELPGRCDLPISIISVDCDYLKQINDTYGHLVGDEYIRMAATAFRAALPHRAQAFRTGGDEFVALVPQTTRERAEEAVADMRSRCGLFKLRDHSVSISCGLSIIESPDENPFDAIARADRSMYEDKASRRRG